MSEQITWATAEDWDAAQAEDNVVHISGDNSDRAGADIVELGTGLINEQEYLLITFDDGSLQTLAGDSEWNIADSRFGERVACVEDNGGDGQATSHSEPFVGRNVAGIVVPENIGGNTTVATVSPEYTAGGVQIQNLTFYWQETTNSTGGGVLLFNSSGGEEVGFASDNPEWNSYSASGWSEFNGGTSYEVWVKTEFDFDWSAGTVTITCENASDGGSVDSTTVDLINGIDVEYIEIRQQNGEAWSTSNMVHWFDGFDIDSGAWTEDFSKFGYRNSAQGNAVSNDWKVLPSKDTYPSQISGLHDTGAADFSPITDAGLIMNGGRIDRSDIPEFTCMAWVKGTNTSTQTISSADRSEYHRVDFVDTQDGTGNAAFSWEGTDMPGSTPITDGEWHHVAAVLDGSTQFLYIDGEIDAQTSNNGDYGTSATRNIQIGDTSEGGGLGEYDASEPFTGEMEDFYINFEVGLSQETIQAIADAGRGYIKNYVQQL